MLLKTAYLCKRLCIIFDNRIIVYRLSRQEESILNLLKKHSVVKFYKEFALTSISFVLTTDYLFLLVTKF